MAQTYANEVSGLYDVPATKPSAGVVGGRMRRFRATFSLASQASGDTIVLAKIPPGHTFSHGLINGSATAGSGVWPPSSTASGRPGHGASAT